MFRKFANLTDEAEVESKLKLAEYIKKGMGADWMTAELTPVQRPRVRPAGPGRG